MEIADKRTEMALVKLWRADAEKLIDALIQATEEGKIEWNGKQVKNEITLYFILSYNKTVKIRKYSDKDQTSFYLIRAGRERISEESYKRIAFTIYKRNEHVAEISREKNRVPKDSIYNHIMAKYSDERAISFIKDAYQLENKDVATKNLVLRTYLGNMSWKRVQTDRLKGDIYTSVNSKGQRLLIQVTGNRYNQVVNYYRNGKKTSLNGLQFFLAKILIDKDLRKVNDENLHLYYDFKETQHSKKNMQASNIQREKKELVIKNRKSKNEKKIAPKEKQSRQQIEITAKDLIIRGNIFRCMHNNHDIVDVDAIVSVLNKNIEIERIIIPAGYCVSCGVFFIMESTYQSLLRKGRLLCRAVDEKNYRNSIYLNGKLLAQESILKQFGYNVSQTENLSEKRRHKILAVLIDNQILSKSEIICYLDFFIKQRKNEKYKLAVSKWMVDREFIRDYKIGEYTKVGLVYRID